MDVIFFPIYLKVKIITIIVNTYFCMLPDALAFDWFSLPLLITDAVSSSVDDICAFRLFSRAATVFDFFDSFCCTFGAACAEVVGLVAFFCGLKIEICK